MREALITQMDEHDWLLELRLRQLLDPVVAVSPPVRPDRRLRSRRASHIWLVPRLRVLRGPAAQFRED